MSEVRDQVAEVLWNVDGGEDEGYELPWVQADAFSKAHYRQYADALLPLLAEAEARGVERGRVQVGAESAGGHPPDGGEKESA